MFLRLVLLCIIIHKKQATNSKTILVKCRCLQIKIFQDSRYQSLGKTNPSNPLIVEDYADDVLLGMLDPKVIRSVLQEFLGSKPFLAGSTVAAIILEMGFFDGIFGAKNFQKMGSNRWVQQPILYQPELPPLPGAFHQSRQVIPLKRREKNRQAATPDDGMVAMRGQEEVTKIGTLHSPCSWNRRRLPNLILPNLVFMLHVLYVFSCLERCANHSWSRNLWEYIWYSRTVLEPGALHMLIILQCQGGYQYGLLKWLLSVDVNFEILGID